MEGTETLVDQYFPLFSKPSQKVSSSLFAKIASDITPNSTEDSQAKLTKQANPASSCTSFSDLGLASWAVQTCQEMGMKRPTPVQEHCIPRILAGNDVLGISLTGSGKTAAFALPILHRLMDDPYGVFALVVTPTRELADQLAEQFKAMGACLNLRCAVIIGGVDIIKQGKTLMQRPHVVIATPGRIKVLLEENPDIPAVFSKAKFLVLDEADRLLDASFEDELKVLFQIVPRKRQTLLFSATMTNNLQTLLEISANKAYFYEAYEGFKTVDSLRQQYVFIPKNVKDVYLFHILSRMNDLGIRSAMVFVSTCRTCHLLSLLLEELELEIVALHSLKSQSLRRAALHEFKSERILVLLATDVASRGLDIPAVDLVINYDLPRYPRDYVHRVGRTARVGRGGLALSFVTQNDVVLFHRVEDVLGKKLDPFECKEKEVLEGITKVYKARRVVTMKMMDDGFEDKLKERKDRKARTLKQKSLKDNRKRRGCTFLED